MPLTTITSNALSQGPCAAMFEVGPRGTPSPPAEGGLPAAPFTETGMEVALTHEGIRSARSKESAGRSTEGVTVTLTTSAEGQCVVMDTLNEESLP